MNKKDIEAFAKEAAKGIKTEKDLIEFGQHSPCRQELKWPK